MQHEFEYAHSFFEVLGHLKNLYTCLMYMEGWSLSPLNLWNIIFFCYLRVFLSFKHELNGKNFVVLQK